MRFRVNPRYGTEEQVAATTTKRTDTHFIIDFNNRYHHRTKYIESGDLGILFSPSGK